MRRHACLVVFKARNVLERYLCGVVYSRCIQVHLKHPTTTTVGVHTIAYNNLCVHTNTCTTTPARTMTVVETTPKFSAIQLLENVGSELHAPVTLVRPGGNVSEGLCEDHFVLFTSPFSFSPHSSWGEGDCAPAHRQANPCVAITTNYHFPQAKLSTGYTFHRSSHPV